MQDKSPKRKGGTSKTSWGKVADWYSEYLQTPDNYQTSVILPNSLRLLALTKHDVVLDLACGEGFFTREFAKSSARVVGTDIAPKLIARAKNQNANARIAYHVAPANTLSFAKAGEFTAAACVLALQNIEDSTGVFKEVHRVLKKDGRFVFVINHPAFRVLKRSSWGWDEAAQVQYRRIDGYLSAAKVSVDMHPGGGAKPTKTISYHRSLQDFVKALAAAGFAITRLEEWTSHKQSGTGPRQKAEDSARKEIPLFMAVEVRPK